MVTSICIGIVYGCFPSIMADVSTCHRDHMAHKAETIYHLSLTRKVCWPTPALDQRLHQIPLWSDFKI